MSKDSEYVPIHHIRTKEMNPLGFTLIDLVGRSGKNYDSSILHRHTYFELFYFSKGSGVHEIDFNKFSIENNSVHFVSPGQIHKLRLNNSNGYVLCFTEDFISLNEKESFTEKFPFFDSSGGSSLKLNKELGGQLLSLICSIQRDINLLKENPDLIRSYLNIILLKIKVFSSERQKVSRKVHKNKKQKVTDFKKLINAGFLRHKSVSVYASEMNISPNHLNALCKKHEGKTATRLVQERMVLESKRLLYATDMNIKEISFYLCFEDVPYFNRFFKKHTSLTPIQYRQQSLKNR